MAPNELKIVDRDEALKRMEHLDSNQRLVVDFDQTLFLRNSSQEFIRMARPYLFGTILYKIVEILHPWTWFSKSKNRSDTRDWFHVWVVTIFFPWTWLIWRYKAKQMAEIWTNDELGSVIRKREKRYNILSSQGFMPIIKPVLEHMDVEFGKIDACRLFGGYSDRMLSKVTRVRDMIGHTVTNRSAVITDSEDDRTLLKYVDVPLLVEWPSSDVRSVTSHYIPFYYMYKVKHKGFAPILRDILFVDLLLLLLAFSWISPIPFLHGIGIAAFFMSFLLIYEIGYMENDEVAYELEASPVLGSNFEEKRDYISYVEPWFWALGMTFIGAGIFKTIDVLASQGTTSIPDVLASPLFSVFGGVYTNSELYILVGTWAIVLSAQRFVFRLYNYADKMTRTWINPFLQSFKSLMFMTISTSNLVGAVALLCQAFSRSFGYFLYRWSRKTWPGDEVYLARFIMFPTVLFILGNALGTHYKEFMNFQSLIIVLWISSRAIKPLIRTIKNARHVSKDTWSKSSK